MCGFNLLYLLAFAGSLDVRAVQINEHFAEDVVNFFFVTGQLLVSFIQQTMNIVLKNMMLFDGEGVDERQGAPFKNLTDIIAAYIDEGVGKRETIVKSAVVDDISGGDDPQLLRFAVPQNTIFVFINKGH